MDRASIFHWKGGLYTMGSRVDMPWVGGSIYHDHEGRYAMGRRSILRG